MRPRVAAALTLVAMTVALALPIALAVHLASSRVLEDAESLRVLGYARNLLQRSESAAQQVETGIKELLIGAAADPCMPQNVARMRRIHDATHYVQVVGYVKDGQLLCSSLGADAQDVRLGPVDYKTRFASVRYDVAFPSAPGRHFTLVEHSGYAAGVNKDALIDSVTAEKKAILGTYTASNGRALAVRGRLQPEWMADHDSIERTFFDRGHAVAVVRSRRWDIGALAALPSAHADQGAPAHDWFIPIGALVGLLLAFGVYRASARWRRPPSR